MRDAGSNFMNGVPELLVLRCLRDREMYGYELVQEIKGRTDAVVTLGEGVVYPLLHALERNGALQSRRKSVRGEAASTTPSRRKAPSGSRGCRALVDPDRRHRPGHAGGRPMPEPFEPFARRLLRAGVAPVHVRRYLRDFPSISPISSQDEEAAAVPMRPAPPPARGWAATRPWPRPCWPSPPCARGPGGRHGRRWWSGRSAADLAWIVAGPASLVLVMWAVADFQHRLPRPPRGCLRWTRRCSTWSSSAARS